MGTLVFISVTRSAKNANLHCDLDLSVVMADNLDNRLLLPNRPNMDRSYISDNSYPQNIDICNKEFGAAAVRVQIHFVSNELASSKH